MLKADITITLQGRLVFARYGKSFKTRTQFEVYKQTLQITLSNEEIKTRLYVDARYVKERTK